jgi:hypothetical protein
MNPAISARATSAARGAAGDRLRRPVPSGVVGVDNDRAVVVGHLDETAERVVGVAGARGEARHGRGEEKGGKGESGEFGSHGSLPSSNSVLCSRVSCPRFHSGYPVPRT